MDYIGSVGMSRKFTDSTERYDSRPASDLQKSPWTPQKIPFKNISNKEKSSKKCNKIPTSKYFHFKYFSTHQKSLNFTFFSSHSFFNFDSYLTLFLKPLICDRKDVHEAIKNLQNRNILVDYCCQLSNDQPYKSDDLIQHKHMNEEKMRALKNFDRILSDLYDDQWAVRRKWYGRWFN